MRKFRLVLAVLAVTLVFGLAFVGCDNGSTKNAPEMRLFVTGTRDSAGTFTPVASFTVGGAPVAFRIRFVTPYQNVGRGQLIVKKGGDVWLGDYDFWNVAKSETEVGYIWYGYQFAAGSYTAEFYVEDIDGKRSNTLSASFTVNP